MRRAELRETKPIFLRRCRSIDDSSPRNIHVAAAASPRARLRGIATSRPRRRREPVSADYPRRGRGRAASPRNIHVAAAASPRARLLRVKANAISTRRYARHEVVADAEAAATPPEPRRHKPQISVTTTTRPANDTRRGEATSRALLALVDGRGFREAWGTEPLAGATDAAEPSRDYSGPAGGGDDEPGAREGRALLRSCGGRSLPPALRRRLWRLELGDAAGARARRVVLDLQTACAARGLNMLLLLDASPRAGPERRRDFDVREDARSARRLSRRSARRHLEGARTFWCPLTGVARARRRVAARRARARLPSGTRWTRVISRLGIRRRRYESQKRTSSESGRAQVPRAVAADAGGPGGRRGCGGGAHFGGAPRAAGRGARRARGGRGRGRRGDRHRTGRRRRLVALRNAALRASSLGDAARRRADGARGRRGRRARGVGGVGGPGGNPTPPGIDLAPGS